MLASLCILKQGYTFIIQFNFNHATVRTLTIELVPVHLDKEGAFTDRFTRPTFGEGTGRMGELRKDRMDVPC